MRILAAALLLASLLPLPQPARAQSVALPSPRLLTLMPMGAKAGTTVEVAITGEALEGELQLLFSSPKLTAQQKTNDKGEPENLRFLVTIAPDTEPGIFDARLMTRLGISSARAFSVGILPEVTRAKPNTTLESALELAINSLCNATTTAKAVDFYKIHATRSQHLLLECIAAGIESKLTPVLIVADSAGRDLAVNRRTGLLDFRAPEDGTYILKVHGLTFQGGPENFYRLAIHDVGDGPYPPPHPSVRSVGAASLPSAAQTPATHIAEAEPNDTHAQPQKIQLPCTVTGAFATAADVDTFEFQAHKGEVWWVEAVSERAGHPTDPFIVVQRVVRENDRDSLLDIAEFNDIASPVKLSSNGYAYDGPPYDAGSADPLGKLQIPEDGTYHLQIRDLFGGTRAEPRHTYSLILRKAVPDFTLVAWALHMELRNGDRAALSKPVALRSGATMAFDVVAIRRDGFDGEIQLSMNDLPKGITATGLRIPPGKSTGSLLLTAAEDAPRSLALARIRGHASINGTDVTHECPVASMIWPIRDASSETPVPRLMADFPVSTGAAEVAPLTIAPAETRVWEAGPTDKLTIPLKLTWRGEFSGGAIKLKPLGTDLAALKPIEVPAKADSTDLLLDLATLKLAPGDYSFAMHGGVVSKYPSAPSLATATATATADTTSGKTKPPADTVDIVVSEPIRFRVLPPPTK